MREKGAGEKGNELKKLSSKKEDKLRLGGAKGGVELRAKNEWFFSFLFFFFPSSIFPLPSHTPTLTFGMVNLHPTLQIARVKRVSKMGEMNPAKHDSRKHDSRPVQLTENNPRQRCNNE